MLFEASIFGMDLSCGGLKQKNMQQGQMSGQVDVWRGKRAYHRDKTKSARHLRHGLMERAETEEETFWEGGVSVGWLASDASRYLVLSSSTSVSRLFSISQSIMHESSYIDASIHMEDMLTANGEGRGGGEGGGGGG